MKLERRGNVSTETQEASLEEQKPSRETDRSQKKKQWATILYMVILFAVALAIVALSYLVQHRRNADAIADLTDRHNQITLETLQNLEQLQKTNQEQKEQLEQLEKELSNAQNALLNAEKALSEAQTNVSDYEQRVSELEERLDGAERRNEFTTLMLRILAAQARGEDTSELLEALRDIEDPTYYLNTMGAELTELYETLIKETEEETDD